MVGSAWPGWLAGIQSPFNDTIQLLKSRLRNTLVPSNFRNPTPVPIFLRLRRSGVKCLFREKMRKTQQHNVNKARIIYLFHGEPGAAARASLSSPFQSLRRFLIVRSEEHTSELQ